MERKTPDVFTSPSDVGDVYPELEDLFCLIDAFSLDKAHVRFTELEVL